MVLMGTMLEAVLVSEIDDFCVDSPASNGDFGTRPIVYPCHGGDNQAFTLVDGRLCRSPNVCLTSYDDSDQSEVIQAPTDTENGSVWKLENGNLVNAFGLCLERARPTEDNYSMLIQAKCDPENTWQKFRF